MRTSWSQARARRLWMLCALALCTPLTCASPLHADAGVAERVEGLGPDAQLTGGGGFGVQAQLDNFFLARARLGALYAEAPWIASLGLAVDVGALAGLGLGGELELSHRSGPYASAGLARVDGARWMAHASLGFMIFGLEWQHVFGAAPAHDAVLFEVKLPLGVWWLQKRQQTATEPRAASVHAAQVRPRGPTRSPPSATSTAREPEAMPAESSLAPPEPAAPAAGSPRATASQGSGDGTQPLARAQLARARGDRLAEALALSQAYALRPDPSVALQLAEAELSLGKPSAALSDWQRLGDVQRLPVQQRERAERLRQAIEAALGRLRLSVTGAAETSDLVAQIDAAPAPGALLGYDVAVDPGEHTLQLLRADEVIAQQRFTVEPGALVRLSIALPAP